MLYRWCFQNNFQVSNMSRYLSGCYMFSLFIVGDAILPKKYLANDVESSLIMWLSQIHHLPWPESLRSYYIHYLCSNPKSSLMICTWVFPRRWQRSMVLLTSWWTTQASPRTGKWTNSSLENDETHRVFRRISQGWSWIKHEKNHRVFSDKKYGSANVEKQWWIFHVDVKCRKVPSGNFSHQLLWKITIFTR